jgi:hypothetical protein
VYLPWHREQVALYGLTTRVVDVRALQITPDQAVAANDDPAAYQAIKKTFIDLASTMVRESGVDVVLSAGGLFALLSARDHVQVPGALVANPTLLAVRQAEASVAITRAAGTPVSRGSTFARATQQAVDELLTLVQENRR